MHYFVLLSVMAGGLLAERQEVGLTLGRIGSADRAGLSLGSGTALQANYGHRIYRGENAEVFGEVHFLAGPLREVASANRSATRDVATLFVTPGVRVKWRPGRRWSPYVAAGGGLAVFEQSLTRLDGAPNQAPRTINRGVFGFGGGVDVPVWRFVAVRGEIRDFYSGSPAYGPVGVRGGQHNVVAGGGFVLRFR